MSMSTRIEDLPGPSVIEPNIEPQIEPPAPVTMPTLPNEVLNELSNIKIRQDAETLKSNVEDGGIRMNIKKKVHFKDELEHEPEQEQDLLSFIKMQINEENLLLLLLLVLSTRTEFDSYIVMISRNYFSNDSIITTVFKSFIILVIYLVIKHYFLPKIKV